MNTKICHKCKQVKYINKFYKCKTSKDGLQNICMICCGLWNKRYTLEHNETKKICNKNWQLKNPEYYNQRYLKNKKEITKLVKKYQKHKKKTDINFRIISNLRSRLSQALNNNWKAGHTIDLLMCSIPKFKKHIESLWLTEMSWCNYGFGNNKWNIDHIIPCSFFKDYINDPVEQYMCFRWQNCQPMWQIDNFKKSNKIG